MILVVLLIDTLGKTNLEDHTKHKFYKIYRILIFDYNVKLHKILLEKHFQRDLNVANVKTVV